VITKGDKLAARAEEAADIALGSAQIAKKAAEKVVEAIPTPDPRADVNYQRLAGLEQSMLAMISPRHRNRWPELRAFEERIVDNDRKQEELRVRLGELHERRQRADAEYATALAGWMASGQQEPKPLSEVTALDQAIVEGQAKLAAFDALRDRILEEKIAFAKKHRKRLVRDAERATEQAKARYLKFVDQLANAREELIGLRETTVWASLFPSETLVTPAPSHVLVGGRLSKTEPHLPGLKRELPAHAVLALLRADAEHLASVSTLEQAAAMQGVSEAMLKRDVAMWADSEEGRVWQKREKERLIEQHTREWGQRPAEFG
jgi:hypothetical protein